MRVRLIMACPIGHGAASCKLANQPMSKLEPAKGLADGKPKEALATMLNAARA
jgi:hypothetical protein